VYLIFLLKCQVSVERVRPSDTRILVISLVRPSGKKTVLIKQFKFFMPFQIEITVDNHDGDIYKLAVSVFMALKVWRVQKRCPTARSYPLKKQTFI